MTSLTMTTLDVNLPVSFVVWNMQDWQCQTPYYLPSQTTTQVLWLVDICMCLNWRYKIPIVRSCGHYPGSQSWIAGTQSAGKWFGIGATCLFTILQCPQDYSERQGDWTLVGSIAFGHQQSQTLGSRFSRCIIALLFKISQRSPVTLWRIRTAF
jgi:hypothetical protein